MAELEYSSSGQTPEGMAYLEELAFDLRNNWEHGADDIWRKLDAALWAATHNPQVVLQTVARTRLRSALAERWRDTMEGVGDRLAALAAGPLWAMRGKNREELVAYIRERLAREADDAPSTTMRTIPNWRFRLNARRSNGNAEPAARVARTGQSIRLRRAVREAAAAQRPHRAD